MGNSKSPASEKELMEKREFARTEVNLPVQYTVLNSEEYAKLRERRKTDPRPGRDKILPFTSPATSGSRREESDYDIRTRLEVINNKLDYLIGLIMGGVEKREYERKDVVVELSGAGLRMMTYQPISPGMCLDLCVMVPFFPYVIDDIYGQVRRVIPLEKSGEAAACWEIAVEFIQIEDAVREKLIQLTFEKQRELLRSRKE